MHEAFYENVTEYFVHAQTVCTRPLLGEGEGGGRGGLGTRLIQPTLDSLTTLCSPITLKEVLIMTTKNQDSYSKSTLQESVHYNWVHFIYMYLTVEVGVA